MTYHCAVISAIIFTVASQGAAQEPAAGLESPRLLLLRNGQTLEGQITRLGDRYVVASNNSEVRVPARDVDLVCHDLDEAYRLKGDKIAPGQVNAHLDLAEWCLKQRQYRHATDELTVALRLEPDNPRAGTIERRLKQAAAATARVVQEPTSKTAAISGASPVSTDQLDRLMRELPPRSVEQFTATIQPLILNRCGASGCHGSESKSEFRLFRPTIGQNTPRRFTQRNLYAAMTAVNRDSPLESPLLKVPQAPHGTAPGAIFGNRDDKAYQQLVAWVKTATKFAAPAAPVTIRDPNDTLNQKTPLPHKSQSSPPLEDAPNNDAGNEPAESVRATPAGSRGASVKKAPNVRHGAGEPFVPKDPFDPAIFNRRFPADPDK